MKHLLSILILLGYMFTTNADDHPLPSLDDYVESKDGMQYILQRCYALYEFHSTVLDDTDEIQALKNAAKIYLFNEVRYPDNEFSEEEHRALLSAYMNTKIMYIQDDNSICNEILSVIDDWAEQ